MPLGYLADEGNSLVVVRQTQLRRKTRLLPLSQTLGRRALVAYHQQKLENVCLHFRRKEPQLKTEAKYSDTFTA
jgi:hypothetical protein